MKTIIWLSTIIGISPVVILSLVASIVAFASKGQHSNGAGSVTHYYASTVFLEIGSIKFAVKPAILPAVLICSGSALVVLGVRRLIEN